MTVGVENGELAGRRHDDAPVIERKRGPGRGIGVPDVGPPRDAPVADTHRRAPSGHYLNEDDEMCIRDRACNRAAACAAMVDGGSVNSATCMSNCTTMNEAGPPNGGDVVLYRSDYVTDLTACVVAVDCADTLSDKAADDCQTTLAASFSPSAAVVTLCQRLEASTCSQDVTPDCLT